MSLSNGSGGCIVHAYIYIHICVNGCWNFIDAECLEHLQVICRATWLPYIHEQVIMRWTSHCSSTVSKVVHGMTRWFRQPLLKVWSCQKESSKWIWWSTASGCTKFKKKGKENHCSFPTVIMAPKLVTFPVGGIFSTSTLDSTFLLLLLAY